MTDMDKMMIEKVARAICVADGGTPDACPSRQPNWKLYAIQARAAITAYNPDDRLREALEEARARSEKGREALKELQQLMDSVYPEISKALGTNSSFVHSANSMILRASGHFFQIAQRAQSALSPLPQGDH